MFGKIWRWLCSFFVSSNSPEVKIKSLAKYDVIQLYKGCSSNVHGCDRTYAPVDKHWLLYPYYKYYRKVLDGLGINNWAENFDCDDWARLYRDLSMACHHAANGTTEGIAVGTFSYKKDGVYPHMINTAIVDDNKVIFIEPQTGLELILSQREKESCWAVYF